MDLRLLQRTLIGVIAVVCAIWAISFLIPVTPWAPEGYRPYPELNIALLGVIALLGELLRRSRKPIDPPANDGAADMLAALTDDEEGNNG